MEKKVLKISAVSNIFNVKSAISSIRVKHGIMFSIEVNGNKPRFLACSEVIDGGNRQLARRR